MINTQLCSTPGCEQPAAFSTRKTPAYCTGCIDAAYIAGGLQPIAAFSSRKDRRATRCLTCAVEMGYPLDYVLEKNRYSEQVCRVCYWGWWGNRERGWHKTELDIAIGDALTESRAETLPVDIRDLASGVEMLRNSLQQWWWPSVRITSTLELLHHDLVLDAAANAGKVNDGMHPVVAQCRLCGFKSVHLPGRMTSELQGRWCLCPSCNSRNKGSCAADISLGFETRGFRVVEPLRGTASAQVAHCVRCGAIRRVSLKQLNDGVVPCYVCDGAANPSNPHRVYLFHFPVWNAYKVGITNTGNDARLLTHMSRGGELIEVVEVPHRAAALWLEAQVLSLVSAWPVAGPPAEQRLDGWTEMWQATAPVRVSLAVFVAEAQGVDMDPQVMRDWEAHQFLAGSAQLRDPGEAVDMSERHGAELILTPGDRVCFTGEGAGRVRAEWGELARRLGLKPTGDVGAAVSLLVAADPSRITGKIRRAVELGVPIASYSDFEAMALSPFILEGSAALPPVKAVKFEA